MVIINKGSVVLPIGQTCKDDETEVPEFMHMPYAMQCMVKLRDLIVISLIGMRALFIFAVMHSTRNNIKGDMSKQQKCQDVLPAKCSRSFLSEK